MSIPNGLTAGTWKLDPTHSEVGFSVRHAGISKVRGAFDSVEAELNVGDSLDSSTVTAHVQTDSINTRSEQRDEHLRSADFFDSEAFPTIDFVSTKISGSGESYDMLGDLTIKGVTKEVTVEVEFNGLAVDPFGVTRSGFSGETTINRKDFGLVWNAQLETGGFLVGDKITITLDLSFTSE